ncbi:MAG: DinB family protein [Candidatus Limnocylindria bacterium]
MSGSILADAFGHHAWATFRVMDACEALTPGQLETNTPGTFGPIIDTLRHLVGADSWYLHRLSGERYAPIQEADEAAMGLPELRSAMDRHAAAWPEIIAADPDPDEFIEARRDDGTGFRATRGVRLAQVLHHGTDHRSQICTALTALGIEPPDIGVWGYADTVGRAGDVPTGS